MQARVRPANPGRFAKPGAPGAHSLGREQQGPLETPPNKDYFGFGPVARSRR